MPRTLNQWEFEAIKQRLLAEAPPDLSREDFERWMGPRFAGAIAEAENSPPRRGGSMGSRLVGGLAQNLNPMALVQGLAQAAGHPLDTLIEIANEMGGQVEQSRERWRAGRPVEAIGHGLAAAVPLLGPAAARAGESGAAGDVAGAIGQALGLAAPVFAPRGVRAGARMAKAAPGATTIASALERGAAKRVVRTMAPEVGPQKLRFGGMAEKVAPQLLKTGEASTWTREGLHGNVQRGLAQAESALDAAADARLEGRAYKTGPIIADLMGKRRALTAEAITADRPISALVGEGARPVPSGLVQDATTERMIQALRAEGRLPGEDVIPAPNAARVAEIDRAIKEIQTLGPMARFESLRRIRQAYDGAAKAVYAPATTTDFLAKQGAKLGAADVTGTLRESLAKFDPQTAAANAKYSLYRTANDVLEATVEVERSRPRVGRKIMTRLTTTLAGEQAAGVPGAVAGFVLAPVVDAALSAGVTTQLKVASMMSRLAQAIRSGNLATADTLKRQLSRLTAQGAILKGQTATSPSGFQAQPATASGAHSSRE